MKGAASKGAGPRSLRSTQGRRKRPVKDVLRMRSNRRPTGHRRKSVEGRGERLPVSRNGRAVLSRREAAKAQKCVKAGRAGKASRAVPRSGRAAGTGCRGARRRRAAAGAPGRYSTGRAAGEGVETAGE